MKITCIVEIGIVTKKLKGYWYKRKGYYIGKTWVKPKKIRKFKYVQIKEPFLSGSIELQVDIPLKLGCCYIDEHKRTYVCIDVENLKSPISILQGLSTILGKTFKTPTQLLLVQSSFSEGSMTNSNNY